MWTRAERDPPGWSETSGAHFPSSPCSPALLTPLPAPGGHVPGPRVSRLSFAKGWSSSRTPCAVPAWLADFWSRCDAEAPAWPLEPWRGTGMDRAPSGSWWPLAGCRLPPGTGLVCLAGPGCVSLTPGSWSALVSPRRESGPCGPVMGPSSLGRHMSHGHLSWHCGSPGDQAPVGPAFWKLVFHQQGRDLCGPSLAVGDRWLLLWAQLPRSSPLPAKKPRPAHPARGGLPTWTPHLVARRFLS